VILTGETDVLGEKPVTVRLVHHKSHTDLQSYGVLTGYELWTAVRSNVHCGTWGATAARKGPGKHGNWEQQC
jgi:hypothetical protein